MIEAESRLTRATASTSNIGVPWINITIFTVFAAMTLLLVLRASRHNRTPADYYTAGRAFTGMQNGVAIAGDYLSAGAFLGITGAVTLYGYDGFLYATGFVVAWLVALLLVAELVRNTGQFTVADVLAFRLRERPVRVASALVTLVVCFLYLLAQMAGAGGLVALLLGVTAPVGQYVVIAAVGLLMVAYVLIGGMKGTTWVQIAKASLLLCGAGLMTVWVLTLYKFNISSLLGGSVATAGAQGVAHARDLLAPGREYGMNNLTKLNIVSSSIALIFGPAGLPHVLTRFYTVPNAKEARRSVTWAIWLIGTVYLFTVVLGYGAAALVGPKTVQSAPGGQNSAALLLAYELGGTLLLGFIAAVAFATIVAVVAGLALTAATSFAHDVYASVIKQGQACARDEIIVARRTVVVIGMVAILGGMLAIGQNVAFLVALAFAVAASANMPTLVFALFWRRFNTRGALWSMYGGLASSVLLIIFSPVVSGKVDPLTGVSLSMVKNTSVDFSWFPLENPGIVSVPLGFLFGVLGTLMGAPEPDHDVRHAEMEVRSLTGAGSEAAVDR